jgi:GTP-binding protein Era
MVSPEALAKQLIEVSNLRDWTAIVPVSAVAEDQLDVLTKVLIDLLPISPALYPADAVTDETLENRICELIREAALEGVRDELPHSIAVTIDEMSRRKGQNLTDIHANIFVERDSQKGIIIGHKGSRLIDVGRRSRLEIEKLIGHKVFLGLRVKVASDWQRDPKQLGKLGF